MRLVKALLIVLLLAVIVALGSGAINLATDGNLVPKLSLSPSATPTPSAVSTPSATPSLPAALQTVLQEDVPVSGSSAESLKDVNILDLFGTPVPTPTPEPTPLPTAAPLMQGGEYLKELSASMLEEINSIRGENGLKTLEADTAVQKVAAAKALEMAQYDYFEHTSPISGEIDKQFEKFGSVILGKSATHIGENLLYAYGYGVDELDAKILVEGWMESPSHKENILDKNFSKSAVSAYITEDGKLYAVQSFYTP